MDSFIVSPRIRKKVAEPSDPAALAERAASAGLDIQELRIDEPWIDPCRPSLRRQLVKKLCGGRSTVAIERMTGNHGGLNMGIWLLRDTSRSLVLKMVTSGRCMGMPTETEGYINLAERHPQIMEDDSIAFPTKIFTCIASDGSRRDLIVMREVEGECFANTILRKLNDDRHHEDLMFDFAGFGAFLAGFHSRHHSVQHGDCQPANVFYDEASRRFTLIDVADMGSSLIKDTDVMHFSKSILSFAKRYGHRICEDAKRHFEAGYAQLS